MEKTRNDRLAEYVRKKHPGIEASIDYKFYQVGCLFRRIADIVKANILQNAFNDCLGAIDSTSVTNKDGAEAMKAALRKILNMELDTLT